MNCKVYYTRYFAPKGWPALLKLVAVVVGMVCALTMPTGCSPDEFPADSQSTVLSFSVDALSFDTVFTAMGSTTQRLTVYNHTADNLRLSSVRLLHGSQSRFRLNVDGDTALTARDVEIASGDSIFIFVQANINPTDATSPFLVSDSIVFSNGQYLPLLAYGRNAYYHRKPDTVQSWLYHLDCNAWTASQHDRPHIILGNAVVPEGQTLTLLAGDEVYFGPDAMLIIDSAACLQVQGVAGNEVLFSSVRHDGWYSFLPGQWQMLWFYTGSSGDLKHAVVENGTGGIRAYPTAAVTLADVEVRNMSDAAIVGQNATISGGNVLVHSSQAALMLIGGGTYYFSQCTFVDYWSYSSRDTTAVVVSNFYPLEEGYYAAPLVSATFSRCIIYGNRTRGEVSLNAVEGVEMNYRFTECLVRGGEWDEDPLFVAPSNSDYHLQDGSPATGIGYVFLD